MKAFLRVFRRSLCSLAILMGFWIANIVSYDHDWTTYKGSPIILDPPISSLTHWLELATFILVFVFVGSVLLDVMRWSESTRSMVLNQR